MSKTILKGKVISNKMSKTVVVEVERWTKDRLYQKMYKNHKHYKADTGKEDYKIGDEVLIELSKPISKDKKWKVIKKVSIKHDSK